MLALLETYAAITAAAAVGAVFRARASAKRRAAFVRECRSHPEHYRRYAK